MAGLALALSEHFRQAKLYALEPDGLDDTARSLAAGKRQTNDLQPDLFVMLLSPHHRGCSPFYFTEQGGWQQSCYR